MRLDHNRRMILALLHRCGRAGRAELARASGLSTQAVSNIIADLQVQGLVLAEGRRRAPRGQPPRQFTVNPDGAFALGMEVRPDRLRGVLVNLGGRVAASGTRRLARSSPRTVLPVVAELAQALGAEAHVAPDRILGCGLVIPGPFGVEGLSSAGRTVLEGWEGANMPARAAAALDMPVLMDKDANAAAMGERLSGIAQGLDDFCYLYFGAGIGLAVMARGALQRGTHGNAGEVGHVVAVPGGLPCDCGNRGCLEQYASRMALARDLAAAGIEAPDVAAIAALHAAGDARLSVWAARAAETLAPTVGMLENLFDPQAVILGGALPEALLDALIARMALPPGSVARRADRTLPRVLRGALGGMSAALGGAAMVLHDAVLPRPDQAPS
jgi:predicted NBD/HSP70 family sugar kinase